MAATTCVCSCAHLAKQVSEDLDLLKAVVSKDDNLSCGSIVSVRIGQDEYITAHIVDGFCELKDMLADARRLPKDWNDFLQDFVDDPDIIARVKGSPPRWKSDGYR